MAYNLALGTNWKCSECDPNEPNVDVNYLSLMGKRYVKVLLYYGNQLLQREPEEAVRTAEKSLKILISANVANSRILFIRIHLNWACALIKCNRVKEARIALSVIRPYLLGPNFNDIEMSTAKCRLLSLLGICCEKYKDLIS